MRKSNEAKRIPKSYRNNSEIPEPIQKPKSKITKPKTGRVEVPS